MPDYTYLRQGNMPPDPRELWDAFKKLFRSQREGLISDLVAKSKDYVEKEVSSFYQHGKKVDSRYTNITRPTWFSKSYRLRGKLSTRCILGTVYQRGTKIDYYKLCVESNGIGAHVMTTYSYRYVVFPSKKDIVSVIEDCNTRLRDTGIVLGISHISAFISEADIDEFVIIIDADLGIL